MKNYEEKARALYKVLSHGYDLMDLIIFPKKKANPRIALAGHLQNERISVLDVCCGTGNSTIAIGKKNSQNSVIGIDMSADMLRVAMKKTQKSKLDNISFKQMNAKQMDFPSSSFDAVTISLALHEMPQELMESILSEMSRVLKPKGKLYIIDWERPKRPMAAILFSIFPALFEPKVFRKFLRIDWKELLDQFDIQYDCTEYYIFTKLIIAEKEE